MVWNKPLTAAVGEIGGTPIYCAPEQWFGYDDNIDSRVDIFSVGAIFYEMLPRNLSHIKIKEIL
jgi:serine/threonine protein kinase